MNRHGVAAQTSCVLRDGAARLLRIRYCFDGIEKNLILRKPRRGCLEGRTALVPAAYQRFTRSEARPKGASRSTLSIDAACCPAASTVRAKASRSSRVTIKVGVNVSGSPRP